MLNCHCGTTLAYDKNEGPECVLRCLMRDWKSQALCRSPWALRPAVGILRQEGIERIAGLESSQNTCKFKAAAVIHSLNAQKILCSSETR